ncbi:MAG: hypothetical protein FI699_00670 [SAR202 cluster bacterium]|nr:hypothetical protein [SAR202 cluster bacterium]|tara:strand:- start:129 stop:746 length:618 start_codon:yes stop_codon:yes gene_type:complete
MSAIGPHKSSFFLLALLLLPMSVVGQEEATVEVESDAIEIAEQLDQTKTEIFQLFNQGKYGEIAEQYCHPEITCMWNDGTRSKGRQGVVDFFAKLKEFIRVMEVNPTTSDRALYENGKYVVSIGVLGDSYEMTSGNTFDLNSSWMATLVYEDNKWQLISFSSSTNAFDNPVIDGFLMLRTIWSAGIGLVIGVVLTLLFRRKKKVD